MSFTPFPRFPPELRQQIWAAALPESINPAAFLFRRDLWKWSVCEEPEDTDSSGYTEQVDDERPIVSTVLPAPVPLKIPLLFTCLEARAIALAWLRKQDGVLIQDGIENVTVENSEKLAVSIAFEPSRDALYVTWHELPDFYFEASEAQETYERGSYEVGDMPLILVQRLAIHAETLTELRSAWQLGRTLGYWFDAVEEILMIVDIEEKLHFNVQERWEFESFPVEDDLTQAEIEKRWPRPKSFYQIAEETRLAIGKRLGPENQLLKVRPVYMRKR